MASRPLAQLLTDAALANADRLALSGDKVQLTYRALLSGARELAGQLRSQGLVADDAVMVRVSNHPLDFVAFLAVWLAAAVVVPVHRSAPAGVVAAMQAKAQCLAQIDGLRVDALLTRGDVAGDRAMLREAALVIFTSGSTGLPKGVVLSHRAFAGKLAQNQRLLGLAADDVTLLLLNNTFSFGIWTALIGLIHGGTVLTHSQFAPTSFIDTLVSQRVSRVNVVPTMIRATFATIEKPQLERAARELRTLGALQDMVIGGESLAADLSARLRYFIAPARLYDIYGLTETATCDFVLRPQDYDRHPDSIGRPAAGIRFRIAADDGRDCEPGQIGELQLQSPFIMPGYLADEQLTHAAFMGDWFRTGDLARSDGDGFVSIAGRLKELIVRGGNKITPLEVERALVDCPGVAAALVVGTPDPILGQRINALLIARASEQLDARRIREELRKRLERYKHPDNCYVGEQLPLGRTGKVDRSQLAAIIRSGAVAALATWHSPIEPSTQ